MSVDKDIVENVISQSGGVLEKAYDDLAHPSAKSIGNTASLIPRTIGVWLSKWEKWVINGEESIRLTAQAVQEKASKIPEEKLTEPEPYVAVPAIQQLSYCYNSEELREMYANLLVNSMNLDTKGQVHPSFVDIIKQLAPLDAKALEKIRDNKGFLATVDVRCSEKDNNNQYFNIQENYSIDLQSIFRDPNMQAASLKNLERLGLIEIDHSHWLEENDTYERIEKSDYFMSIKDEIASNISDKWSHVYLNKGVVSLTAFGKSFCNVCCL